MTFTDVMTTCTEKMEELLSNVNAVTPRSPVILEITSWNSQKQQKLIIFHVFHWTKYRTFISPRHSYLFLLAFKLNWFKRQFWKAIGEKRRKALWPGHNFKNKKFLRSFQTLCRGLNRQLVNQVLTTRDKEWQHIVISRQGDLKHFESSLREGLS